MSGMMKNETARTHLNAISMLRFKLLNSGLCIFETQKNSTFENYMCFNFPLSHLSHMDACKLNQICDILIFNDN